MSHNDNKIKKGWRTIILFGVIIFFGVQLIVPVVVPIKQVKAVIPVSEVGPQVALDVTTSIFDRLWKALKAAADVTFKNVLKTYVHQFAQTAALKLTTSGEGQKPLWPTIPLKEIGINAANIAAGDFLDEIANDWLGGNRKCYGYSDISCTADRSCPIPLLDCQDAFKAGKITVGQILGDRNPETGQSELVGQGCAGNFASMQECIALGCKLVKDTSQDFLNEIADNGILDDPAELDFEYVAGAKSCPNSFSLCEQTDQFKINLNIAIRSGYDQPDLLATGKCPVTSIIDNFAKMVGCDDVDSEHGQYGCEKNNIYKDLTTKQRSNLYLAEISKTFNPEASQFGVVITTTNSTATESGIAQAGRELEKKIEGTLDGIKSKITKITLTPPEFIKSSIDAVQNLAGDLQTTYTGTLVADAIGTFTNTLSSKLLERFFEGLSSDNVTTRSSTGIGSIFSGIRTGITAAKLMFADLKKVEFSDSSDINIATNLSTCADINNPTPDTCVIDSGFATAIQQQLTVREAIDAGMLSDTKPFGYAENTAAETKMNYKNGYPYRSLVILRKYRIIPVGWELAAKYMQKYASGALSLKVLIENYDNPVSPYYRLVDPNWVLKSPQLYCAKMGAGEIIEFEQTLPASKDSNKDNQLDEKTDLALTTIVRNTNYCADEQLCLYEDDNGTCLKYGQCIEEKPIWKFSGSECDAQNNSCLAFDNDTAYLTNTVEYNGCSADNAGCQWYCQDWDQAGGEWQCANTPADGQKISLTGQASTCSASDEGCTEFIPITNSGANLLINSSFEYFDIVGVPGLATDGFRDVALPVDMGGTSLPDDFENWSHNNIGDGGNPCLQRSLASNDVYEGLTAARLHYYPADGCTDGDYTSQQVDTGYLTSNRTFTVSLYVKRAEGGTCDETNDSLAVQLSRNITAGNTQYQDQQSVNISNDNWARYAFTFTWDNTLSSAFDNDSYKKNMSLLIRHTQAECDIMIDNVQVEEGGLTDYKAREDSPKSYLTKPPEYLNCASGNVFNDPACNNYALYCSENDVGCAQYTSFRTGNIVNGKITDPHLCDPNDPYSCDQCPAEFDGCQAFRELATTKTPVRPAVDPISFVSDTGLTCPASAVGCEEYTNLEEVALGGEGREYYNEIRQCVLDTDGFIATYYTWEGSDEFGYQLKDYRLKVSNVLGDPAPCTTMAPENPSFPTISWPNCIDDVDLDGGGLSESEAAATCDPADVGVDPDCTEFFDPDGNPYYRLKSRVIYADANCKVYRNSIDNASRCVSNFCSSTGYACVADADCNEVLYHLIPGQGQSCSAEYAGCRAYKGNAGDNSRLIYSEDFENGDTGGWTGNNTYLSNESVTFGGHSLFANDDFLLDDLITTMQIPIAKGNSYKISFWAKAGLSDTPIPITLGWPSQSPPPDPGIIGRNLTFAGQAVARVGEWNRYELGPVYIDTDPHPTLTTIQSAPGNPVYIDNIRFTEIVDNIYRIKDSYTECSGYENCQRYDSGEVIHYLKSFTNLCDESKIGCQVFIDTFNTSTPNIFEYEASGIGPVVNSIPADETVFLVNDPNKSCLASAKGCQRLGKPNINSADIVDSFNDVFLINNPDDYNNILCSFEESGCEAYTTLNGSQYYFKDPGAKVCEYKQVTGQTTSGWYKRETNSGAPDCPVSEGVCENSGSLNGVVCSNADGNIDECIDPDAPTGDELCNTNDYDIVSQPTDGWTGSCPANESGCTEFRDPETVIEDSEVQCDATIVDGGGNGTNSFECDSYYYLVDGVDVQSCNGLVNRDEGCLLFNDTADDNLIYYSSLTNNGQPPNISCEDPTDPICLAGPDANSIIKVRKDRICNRWLECSNAIIQPKENSEDTESLCLEVSVCDKADQNTNSCISWDEFINANQTFSSPAFASKVANYSGLVLAGLDWGRRCNAEPNTICDADIDCNAIASDTCGEPQIIEGKLPIAAMDEVGTIGINGDLITMGDFGDSRATANDRLSYLLTGGSANPPAIANPIPTSVDIMIELGTPWTGDGDTSTVEWTEEQDNGFVPSQNATLDENNVLVVNTTTNANGGAKYNLGSNLMRNQEYVASFKLKWSVEPTVLDRVKVYFHYVRSDGTYTEQDISSDPGFIPSAEWEEYILGPVIAGYDNALPNPNPITSYDRVDLVISYSRTDGNPIPSEFYLDDVSLRPVLQTTEDGGFVTRDCRLYPRDDAKYCSYTDVTNTTYKGWYGYCLEHDPANTNVCINWWPVDLIAGESDIFSNVSIAGYTGRRPLFYCAQAKGLYPYIRLGDQTDDDRYEGCDNDDPEDGTGEACSRCGSGGNDACGCDGCSRKLGGDRDTYDHGISFIADGATGNRTFGVDPSEQFYKYELEKIVWDVNCTGANNGGCKTSHTDWDSVGGEMHPGNNWSFSWANNGNTMDVIANWDAEDRLLSYTWNANDGSNEWGGAQIIPEYYLIETCQDIVQVADLTNEPRVWTERLNSSSGYKVGDSANATDLFYQYGHDFAPFGGMLAPTNNSLPGVDWPIIYVEQRANPLAINDARAGSPYTCSGDCTQRVCINDATEDCSDNLSIDNCIDGGGYCVGLGDGFCSNNVSIRCNGIEDCSGTNNVCVFGTAGIEATGKSFNPWGVDRLQRIFADVILGWRWDPTTFSYAPNGLNGGVLAWQDEYRLMIQCSSNVRLSDFNSEYCGVAPTLSVSVTGEESGPINHNVGAEGGRAVFQLNIHANEQQMPITRIEVDWDVDGDGPSQDNSLVGSYGNGIFTMDKVYQAPVNQGESRYYRPQFRVVDNWGWCSLPEDGDCTDPNSPCRDFSVNNTECGWYDPEIIICAGECGIN